MGAAKMRIVVFDYPGHAFPVQLSRALAARGHDVLHLFFAAFQGPKGPLAPRPGDPGGLEIRALALQHPFAKYDFVRRWLQERQIGRLVARAIAGFAADVVLSGNAPLDVQRASLAAARRSGAAFVAWVQDLYGIAIDRILSRKLPLAGRLIGAWYRGLERRIVADSDHVVTISDDFVPILRGWGVSAERVSVIENWAVLDELPARPRDNEWARAHDLADKLVLLYAGTLGLKHDPALLAALARHFAANPKVRIVVVSEGLGAEWLGSHAGELPNLRILPFEPFERLPDVLAAADVLVAVLESDAGVYSVPSKVLSYLCAGRPILAALPRENLAARLIEQNGAGLAAPPGDQAAFLAAAERLVGDATLRKKAADNALDYARRTFDIDAIAARFEKLLRRASSGASAT